MKKEILDIFDVSYEGSGVAKSEGKVVFVPKCLKGEKVSVKILKENNNFKIGELDSVLVSSVHRINSTCPYFDKCGGCDFQHCDYQYELELKKEIIKREFKKVGFEEDFEIIEASKRLCYRNKLKLEVLNGKLGYFKPKSREFFEVKKCQLATEEINESIEKVRAFLSENKFKFLRSVYFKFVNNKNAICFLFDKNDVFSIKNIKKIEILSGFSVFFAYGEVLESNNTKIFIVKEQDESEFLFDGFKLPFDVSAFNQVNDEMAKKLYDFVLEKCSNKRVVNAYSGQGLLSVLLAKKAKYVYGIEYQNSAHKSAEILREQLKENKLENICGKVEDCLFGVLLRDNIDMIVLDPAREGCKANVLNNIVESKIKEIVYISCNYSTLVRDLKILKTAYKIEEIKVFDMFPSTANMETVAVLKRIV